MFWVSVKDSDLFVSLTFICIFLLNLMSSSYDYSLLFFFAYGAKSPKDSIVLFELANKFLLPLNLDSLFFFSVIFLYGSSVFWWSLLYGLAMGPEELKLLLSRILIKDESPILFY